MARGVVYWIVCLLAGSEINQAFSKIHEYYDVFSMMFWCYHGYPNFGKCIGPLNSALSWLLLALEVYR